MPEQVAALLAALRKSRSWTLIVAVHLVVQWMFFSCAIILYNKYILHTLDFAFPITIVLMHMCFVTACCQLWKRMGWAEVPSVSWVDIRMRFMPVAFFFAASLGLSNTAYLFITVAFIQMMKASMPVFVLLVSFILGLEKPTWQLCGWILLIVAGVTTASANEVEFGLFGFIIQIAAIVCEAWRLALTNKVLVTRGLKLAPIPFLYYMAPLCAFCLFVPWSIMEAPKVFADNCIAFRKVGGLIFFTNASIAFLLNL